jgi:monothiol glutaredoxin
MSAPLKLYIKPGCPWCIMAEDWLEAKGYQYEVINVLSDQRLFDEMMRISGQRRAPTLAVGELVLPDFGPDELAVFLKRHSITP